MIKKSFLLVVFAVLTHSLAHAQEFSYVDFFMSMQGVELVSPAPCEFDPPENEGEVRVQCLTIGVASEEYLQALQLLFPAGSLVDGNLLVLTVTGGIKTHPRLTVGN